MAPAAPSYVTVRLTHRFDAAPGRAFDAWLDPHNAGKWLFATETGRMVHVEINAQAGGKFMFVDRRNGEDIEHSGSYVEIDRPHRLVFDFAVKKYSNETTRVTITIVPKNQGCELTLMHEHVLPEYASRTQEGWTKILEGLAAAIK